MLDQKDLRQVRDYVIRILPELLREEPEIAATIEGMLAQHFPRRDEFARLLDEVRMLREQSEQRFEQMDRRFEQMDRRFEQMDRRFTEMQEQMDRRFTEMQEQMDRRFALQREEMDQRLSLLREEMNERFERADQRFERLERSLLEVRRDIARLQHGQAMILERMDGQEKWLRLVTGNLRREKGQTREDMFAVALRYGLKNPDIAPEAIRLRQKVVDAEGQVFRPGYGTEVDLIAEDDHLTVFEVKATAEPSDAEVFAMKVELVAALNPDIRVRGVLISLAAGEDVRQRCRELGLELVD